VGELDLVRIQQGDRVVAHIPSLGVELEGQVASLGVELHPLTRSTEVVTVFDNADGRLRGGMFAEVEIRPESSRRAVVLPRSALGGSGDERFVYVVDQCRARRRPVTTIDLDDSRVEVREGVREGEVVVVRGVARIADGAAIEAGSGCTAAVAARAEAVR
jgi:membrane fusion protein (multidrug efflux system)